MGHQRWLRSNYGSRVDCYAWGEGVFTTTSDTNGQAPATNLYRDDFGNTSAATAIIAGVALSVQGMAEVVDMESGLFSTTPTSPARSGQWNALYN